MVNYRRLGKSGLLVSEVSFGSWLTFGAQLEAETAEQCMKAAYDGGINFFDNAEGYAGGKSEEVMGAILAKMDWDRTTFVVSSKVFFGGNQPNQRGLCRKHVFEACHAAIRRLRVDYLDLYFCHRPDADTPIEETVRAMDQLIQQGKVLYWGTSEWSAAQIMEAYAIARQEHLTPPTMEQPQYNMLHRDRVEQEYATLYDPATVGLGTTVWSPLAGGLLTGKYNDGVPEDSRGGDGTWQGIAKRLAREGDTLVKKLRAIKQVADDLGVSFPNLSLAWVLKNPHVSTAITGASRPSQVEQNVQASEVAEKLDDAVMQRIDDILAGKA